MKYTALFALLAALLLLSACTTETAPKINESTETPDKTPPPTNIEDTPVVTTPKPSEPLPPVQTPPTSTQEVSADSIFVKGTRYSDKNYVNLAFLTYSKEIEFEAMSMVISNKFYTGTYKYNETISCDNIARVIGARNKYFSTKMNGSDTIICLSPPRDLGASESVDIVGSIGSEVVLTEKLTMPAVIASNEFYLTE